MKTTRTRQRISLALTSAAILIAATACGAPGTGTSSPAAPSGTASPSASMDPGMDASSMGSSMPSSMGATMGASNGAAAMAAETTIHIKSFAYTGPDSVPAGSMVTVMNMDTEAHTLTADDGSFDAVVKPGTSTTFTAPSKPGTYSYHCTYHSNMKGTLTVK
ncbi:cupredoxin domain-containing protein [Arthrobacter sp. ISL-85]|uniref:cupredoxin domain-containing protein n=1 Tax=Arthrobacter sp. ISL-85 TaxID=2819115 RepID=UPI001BE9B06B|nr:cupredoxin domain-containing protein [Arthrobacter sp. ISL-85]MBT2566242.1 cupredoxin domain-containing protein [Arthrobacter sp. ISL-85]